MKCIFISEIINDINQTSANNTEMVRGHTADPMDHMDHHHEEHMSPFLPELDNDTFLHPEHHLIDHILVPNDQESNDSISTIKPPSLEFDQLNHTNPFDNYTTDALGVIPISENVTSDNSTILNSK